MEMFKWIPPLKKDLSFFVGHSGTSPGNATSVRQASCSLMGTLRRWIPLRWPPLQPLGNTTWWVVTEKSFVADIERSNPRESSNVDHVDAGTLLSHHADVILNLPLYWPAGPSVPPDRVGSSGPNAESQAPRRGAGVKTGSQAALLYGSLDRDEVLHRAEVHVVDSPGCSSSFGIRRQASR